MGLFDLIFGRGAKGDDPEDEIDRNKAYGDLYVGGEGRVSHNMEREETNPRAIKNAERLSSDLGEVERRAKEMHLNERHMDKIVGKIERGIDKVGDAKNPIVMRQRSADLRHKMRSGYEKIEKEHENRLEELKRKGATDRRIREEEHKMKKTREDMSEMYRRAGGSGMLK